MKIKAYRTSMNSSGYVSLVAEKGNYLCDGRKRFDCPDVVADFCRDQLEMNTFPEEHVYIFALDTSKHLMGVCEVTKGTVNSSLVSTREIFQKLLMMNATNFIMVHNHPSGECNPSTEDDLITSKVKQAGQFMNIHLTDHVVVGNYGGYFSYLQEGRL